MIVNIIFALWFVFIIMLVSTIVRKAFNQSYIYQFQNYEKTDVPYIILDIQGFQFNFLVDTGCGVSIINKEFIKDLNWSSSKRSIDMMALTSDTLKSDMVTIPLTINGKHIEEDFVLYDKQDIANFQVLYGITLHGILGNEFLENTGCQIDYKNHIVVIP